MPLSSRFEMLADPAERERWELAARAGGLSLAAWLRRLANEAAKNVFGVAVEDSTPDPDGTHSVRVKVLPKPGLCPNCRRKGDGIHPLPACQECNG